ncbi:MAG: hypothetical protein GY842_15250 [bacterium]|nr:hypothetical protein [bacterium]
MLVQRCAGVVLTLCLVLSAGCPKEGDTAVKPATEAETAAEAKPAAPAKVESPVPQETTAQGEVKIDPAVLTQVEGKLAGADAIDGTMDKVVTRCASCRLSMDGSSENLLKVAGYSMHFCTAGCKERFAADTAKLILAMEYPEK